VTDLLKNCELDETYGKVTISAEAKFLTVLLTTFRDNKQALYYIFSMFLQLQINRKTASLSCKVVVDAGSSEKSNAAKAATLIFTAHAHCFKLKRNLLTGKLPDIRAFFKVNSPSPKAFPFSAIASLNSKLNSVPN